MELSSIELLGQSSGDSSRLADQTHQSKATGNDIALAFDSMAEAEAVVEAGVVVEAVAWSA